MALYHAFAEIRRDLARRLQESGGGHWITLVSDEDIETHVFVGGGGQITKGPKHLVGANIAHLPAPPHHGDVISGGKKPSKVIEHKPGTKGAKNAAKKATEHPSYHEHQETKTAHVYGKWGPGVGYDVQVDNPLPEMSADHAHLGYQAAVDEQKLKAGGLHHAGIAPALEARTHNEITAAQHEALRHGLLAGDLHEANFADTLAGHKSDHALAKKVAHDAIDAHVKAGALEQSTAEDLHAGLDMGLLTPAQIHAGNDHAMQQHLAGMAQAKQHKALQDAHAAVDTVGPNSPFNAVKAHADLDSGTVSPEEMLEKVDKLKKMEAHQALTKAEVQGIFDTPTTPADLAQKLHQDLTNGDMSPEAIHAELADQKAAYTAHVGSFLDTEHQAGNLGLTDADAADLKAALQKGDLTPQYVHGVVKQLKAANDQSKLMDDMNKAHDTIDAVVSAGLVPYHLSSLHQQAAAGDTAGVYKTLEEQAALFTANEDALKAMVKAGTLTPSEADDIKHSILSGATPNTEDAAGNAANLVTEQKIKGAHDLLQQAYDHGAIGLSAKGHYQTSLLTGLKSPQEISSLLSTQYGYTPETAATAHAIDAAKQAGQITYNQASDLQDLVFNGSYSQEYVKDKLQEMIGGHDALHNAVDGAVSAGILDPDTATYIKEGVHNGNVTPGEAQELIQTLTSAVDQTNAAAHTADQSTLAPVAVPMDGHAGIDAHHQAGIITSDHAHDLHDSLDAGFIDQQDLNAMLGSAKAAHDAQQEVAAHTGTLQQAIDDAHAAGGIDAATHQLLHGHLAHGSMSPEEVYGALGNHMTGAAAADLIPPLDTRPTLNMAQWSKKGNDAAQKVWDKHHSSEETAANRVSKRLQKLITPQEAEALHDAIVGGTYGGGYKTYHPGNPHAALARLITEHWNASSTKLGSLVGMHAVTDEFGLPGFQNDPGIGDADYNTATKIYKQHTKAARAWARAVYDETQSHFAQEGVTHVSLARGGGVWGETPGSKHKALQDAAAEAGFGNAAVAHVAAGSHYQRPLASWALNQGFSKEGNGENGVTHMATFPVSHIFSHSGSGPGTSYEVEYVPMGHNQDHLVIRGDDARRALVTKIQKGEGVSIQPGQGGKASLLGKADYDPNTEYAEGPYAAGAKSPAGVPLASGAHAAGSPAGTTPKKPAKPKTKEQEEAAFNKSLAKLGVDPHKVPEYGNMTVPTALKHALAAGHIDKAEHDTMHAKWKSKYASKSSVMYALQQLSYNHLHKQALHHITGALANGEITGQQAVHYLEQIQHQSYKPALTDLAPKDKTHEGARAFSLATAYEDAGHISGKHLAHIAQALNDEPNSTIEKHLSKYYQGADNTLMNYQASTAAKTIAHAAFNSQPGTHAISNDHINNIMYDLNHHATDQASFHLLAHLLPRGGTLGPTALQHVERAHSAGHLTYQQRMALRSGLLSGDTSPDAALHTLKTEHNYDAANPIGTHVGANQYPAESSSMIAKQALANALAAGHITPLEHDAHLNSLKGTVYSDKIPDLHTALAHAATAHQANQTHSTQAA